jgi:hypothetical protein
MKQIEESLAMTSCKPLGAMVDIDAGSPVDSLEQFSCLLRIG